MRRVVLRMRRGVHGELNVLDCIAAACPLSFALLLLLAPNTPTAASEGDALHTQQSPQYVEIGLNAAIAAPAAVGHDAAAAAATEAHDLALSTPPTYSLPVDGELYKVRVYMTTDDREEDRVDVEVDRVNVDEDREKDRPRPTGDGEKDRVDCPEARSHQGSSSAPLMSLWYSCCIATALPMSTDTACCE